MNEKKLITAKEFEEKYSIPVETQRKLRSRLRDPLPYVQTEPGGTILYNVEYVKKWMESFNNEG